MVCVCVCVGGGGWGSVYLLSRIGLPGFELIAYYKWV